MSSAKRPFEDSSDRLSIDESLCALEDQSLSHGMAPRVVLSEIFGDFMITVKLRSTSKAGSNDPQLSLAQREVYQNLLLQLAQGKPDTSDHHAEAYYRASCYQSPSPSIISSKSRSRFEDRPTKKARRDALYENISTNPELNATLVSAEQRQENKPSVKAGGSRFEDEHSGSCEEWCEDENGDEMHDYDESHYSEEDEDDNNSENDSLFEFDWLEPIDVYVTPISIVDETPENIAFCEVKLIRRSKMRDDFYANMEEPSGEMAKLAFDLFDRYGCIRREFISHPVIKGSGVWGEELNNDDILLIQKVFVNKAHRRQGFGRRMIDALLEVVRLKTWSFFAFARPEKLYLEDIQQEWDDLHDDATKHTMEDRERDRAMSFWRSLGFRRVASTGWFAFSPDKDHRSASLVATNDFNPPETTSSMLHPLLVPMEQMVTTPISFADLNLNVQSATPPDFLGILQNCAQAQGPTDECWMSQNKDGNTILHLAAAASHEDCIKWIVAQDFGSHLLQSRNLRGETPLELLEFKLEKMRTVRIIRQFTGSVSDKFKGFEHQHVNCLIMLKGLDSFESFMKSQGRDAVYRLARGCTCGQCLEGFMSPRMQCMLSTSATFGFENLGDRLNNESVSIWMDLSLDDLSYVPLRVRRNLATNKSMRQGFVKLWDHIATCLNAKVIPTEPNVLHVVRTGGEWPPDTQNYLKRGGTVESVFLAVCRCAMNENELIGRPITRSIYKDEIAKLPECRNDLEFGFMSKCCGYRPISLTHRVDMRGNTLDEDGNIVDALL